MKKINNKTIIYILIALVLFIIPFFWLKPGEMDLGGDSSRIYFYDPIGSLKSFMLYSVVSSGIDRLIYNQYLIPYTLLLAFLKLIFSSPTVVIAIMNGIKLSGAFIFMFLIIKELFRNEEGKNMTISQFAAATIGALFYTFSPSLIDNMRYALVTHSQVFLNPLIFYFLLRYLKTLSQGYIWIAIFISFIFSANFALFNPPVFAFYPIVLVFLFLYNFFVLQKPFPWKGAIIGLLFFVGLNAFHVIPISTNVFDKGSEINTRTFESFSKVNVGLEYFNAILPLGKVSRNILLPLETLRFSWSLVIIPALTILGFLSLRKKSRTLLLVSIFFLITLFLTSANVTQTGVEIYRKLFSIPGFGMFRNFIGQWQWLHALFYAILVSLAIFSLFLRMKNKYIYLITSIALVTLIARSWIVFDGKIVNVFQRFSKDVSVVLTMDPHYEEILSYIQNIPDDGRVFHMPFTDFGYNIVGGANKGVYVGQSLIPYLIGRNDFPGYQNMDPYSEVFRKLSMEKNYPLIKEMLSLLQVRYVLYNSDVMISDTYFPTFPYGYVGTPASTSAMLKYVRNVSDKKIYETGSFSLYEVEKKHYLPHFYTPSEIFTYDTNPKYDVEYSKALSFFPKVPLHREDPRIAYLDRAICAQILSKRICNQNSYKPDDQNIQITFQRINPTKYKVEITHAAKPFLLVFQSEYNSYWKLFPTKTPVDNRNIADSYFDGDVVELARSKDTFDKNPLETNGTKSVYDNGHLRVNGYANAWYISPDESIGKEKYEFIVEMTAQTRVYYSFIITAISIVLFLLYGVWLLRKKIYE